MKFQVVMGLVVVLSVRPSADAVTPHAQMTVLASRCADFRAWAARRPPNPPPTMMTRHRLLTDVTSLRRRIGNPVPLAPFSACWGGCRARRCNRG
jgi:hypothetical protein